ncbi:hypothetical protein B9Z65_1414 [Elsinoe australis]|uniref:Mating-type protein MAT-1 n=1 Tax=Elsinoe australis TaxID=40998 RepID=A0A2P7YFU3_9PEZI|nr:hypothetical protein B9Z65_1414 [Elsinoe australis]QLL26889.1 MAT1-1-1 [Elsinoe australis]
MAEHMASLLAKFDSNQLSAIFAALNDMPTASDNSATCNSSQSAKSRHGNRKSLKARIAAHGAKLEDNKSARPLNSWMAFRSFYSPIFKSFQQKDISGYVKDLWAADQYKAKWTIIAKSYSVIRERVTKDKLPLDVFLNVVAPHAGALARESYLSIMGWYLVDIDGVKTLKRAFVPSPEMIPESYQTTMVSPQQLVTFCVRQGLVSLSDLSAQRTNTPNLTMATQPTVGRPRSTPAQRRIANARTPARANTRRHGEPRQDNNHAAARARVQQAVMVNNQNAIGNSSSVRQIVYEGNQAHQAPGPYPFIDSFDPLSSADFPIFEPTAGSTDSVFDIGNVSTYVAPPSSERPEDFDIDQFLNDAMMEFNDSN